MKKVIIAGVIVLLSVAIPVSAKTWGKIVTEITLPTWVIDNDSKNPTVIYKIVDGSNTCYVSNQNNATAISCVTK